MLRRFSCRYHWVSVGKKIQITEGGLDQDEPAVFEHQLPGSKIHRLSAGMVLIPEETLRWSEMDVKHMFRHLMSRNADRTTKQGDSQRVRSILSLALPNISRLWQRGVFR